MAFYIKLHQGLQPNCVTVSSPPGCKLQLHQLCCDDWNIQGFKSASSFLIQMGFTLTHCIVREGGSRRGYLKTLAVQRQPRGELKIREVDLRGRSCHLYGKILEWKQWLTCWWPNLSPMTESWFSFVTWRSKGVTWCRVDTELSESVGLRLGTLPAAILVLCWLSVTKISLFMRLA